MQTEVTKVYSPLAPADPCRCNSPPLSTWRCPRSRNSRSVISTGLRTNKPQSIKPPIKKTNYASYPPTYDPRSSVDPIASTLSTITRSRAQTYPTYFVFTLTINGNLAVFVLHNLLAALKSPSNLQRGSRRLTD